MIHKKREDFSQNYCGTSEVSTCGSDMTTDSITELGVTKEPL